MKLKHVQIQSVVLFFIGMLLMSMSFIFRRYFGLNDFTDGLLKGSGIGCAFLSLLFIVRTRSTMTIGRH
jgi:accessory gene regulator protein AgrB